MSAIAITGLIGSGKSYVSDVMEKKGAHVIKADSVVKSLQKSGSKLFGEIVETWGENLLDSSGEIHRKYLANIVFNNPAELQKLEKITHPKVRQVILDELNLMEETSIVLIELPLLKQNDIYLDFLDAVILVKSSYEARLERLIKYRNFKRADAVARLNQQLANSERIGTADFVIDNDSTLAELEVNIDLCWEWIQSI